MGWVLIYQLLRALQWLIIIRVIMSWIVSPHEDNVVVRFIRRVTDPILRPLSDMVPPIGGLDLSPLVALLALQLLQQVVLRLA